MDTSSRIIPHSIFVLARGTKLSVALLHKAGCAIKKKITIKSSWHHIQCVITKNYSVIAWRGNLISKVLALGVADKCVICCALCALSWIFWDIVLSFQSMVYLGCRNQSLIAWHLLLALGSALACWGFKDSIVRLKTGPCRRKKLTLTPVGTILAMSQLESRAASCFQDPCLSFWW